MFGLVGAVLVKLLLNLGLPVAFDIPAVLLRADWVTLILGEEVIEVQLLFLHRYNYRISANIIHSASASPNISCFSHASRNFAFSF